METGQEILSVLSAGIRRWMTGLSLDYARLQEIRIRTDAPLLLWYDGAEYFVCREGGISKRPDRAVRISQKDIDETMELLSNYSMYAFEEEMRQGFLTIRGGHRVGVAGKVILEHGRIKNLQYVSFLNIRLAHQVPGCADSILPYLRSADGIYHTLIISPPRCGKTTILRDLIRQLSDGTGGRNGMNVGVVDERSELGACYQGQPQNALGARTDILDCCPKREGMLMLVRSMAPQVIAVDEIGFREDVEALEYVVSCGVKVLATVHGGSLEELEKKPALGSMIRSGIFERYVLLSSGQAGQVRKIYDAAGMPVGMPAGKSAGKPTDMRRRKDTISTARCSENEDGREKGAVLRWNRRCI